MLPDLQVGKAIHLLAPTISNVLPEQRRMALANVIMIKENRAQWYSKSTQWF